MDGVINCSAREFSDVANRGNVGTDGKTWADMFELLEAPLIQDSDTDCASLSAADITADTPATASYIDVIISAAL